MCIFVEIWVMLLEQACDRLYLYLIDCLILSCLNHIDILF